MPEIKVFQASQYGKNKEPIAGLEPATCSLRMKLTKSYSPFITVFSEDAKIHL